jgi:integrase
VHLRDFYQQ